MIRAQQSMFLLLVGLLLVGCQQLEKKVILSEAGNILEEYHVDQDSVRQGWSIQFDNAGKIMDQTYWKNGKKDSIRTIYYTTGQKEIEERYHNDTIHGLYTTYYPSGSMRFKANFEKGKLQGQAIKFYENGVIQEKVEFLDNQENGPFEEYYPSGNLKWKGQYLNGENEIGELFQYDENNNLIKKMYCDSLHVCRTIWAIDRDTLNL